MFNIIQQVFYHPTHNFSRVTCINSTLFSARACFRLFRSMIGSECSDGQTTALYREVLKHAEQTLEHCCLVQFVCYIVCEPPKLVLPLFPQFGYISGNFKRSFDFRDHSISVVLGYLFFYVNTLQSQFLSNFISM